MGVVLTPYRNYNVITTQAVTSPLTFCLKIDKNKLPRSKLWGIPQAEKFVSRLHLRNKLRSITARNKSGKMHKNIGSALKSATSLLYVEKELLKLLKATRQQVGGGITRIGYVAGIINSDGSKYFEINRKKLVNHAKKLRKIHKFPIFCAVDVFSSEVYERLQEWKLPFSEREVKFRSFWRKIFKSGHITDIFMTPRWEKSKGATHEHETAKEIRLKIHYVQEAH